MCDHPLSKETLPNVQFKLPPTNVALSHAPISWHWVPRRRDWHLPLCFPQEAVGSSEITPQTPSLQTRQNQCPQLAHLPAPSPEKPLLQPSKTKENMNPF